MLKPAGLVSSVWLQLEPGPPSWVAPELLTHSTVIEACLLFHAAIFWEYFFTKHWTPILAWYSYTSGGHSTAAMLLRVGRTLVMATMIELPLAHLIQSADNSTVQTNVFSMCVQASVYTERCCALINSETNSIKMERDRASNLWAQGGERREGERTFSPVGNWGKFIGRISAGFSLLYIRNSRAGRRLNILKVSTNIGQSLCLWGLCGSRSSGQSTV